MSTAKKILSNTGIQVLGKAIITFVALFFITRPLTSLGDEFYGQYAFVYRFLGFFAIFADFGLFTIAVREMSEHMKSQNKILSNIFGLRILLVVSVMAIAGLAGFLLGQIFPEKFNFQVQMGIWLAGLSVVFTMMGTTLASVFQVHYRMLWPTIALVMSKIAMAVVISWALLQATDYSSTASFWQDKFYLFFLAGVLGNFVLFAVTYLCARRFSEPGPRFDFKFWKAMLYQALPYGIALILNTFHFQVDSVMIYLMREDGAAEVGAYDIAFKILEILNIIPIYFLNAVLPVLTREIGNEKKADKIINYSFRFLLAISVPVFFGGLAVSYQIMNFIIKGGMEGYFIYSPWVLSVLLLSLVFIYLNSVFNFTLIAQKRQNELLKINGIALAFNVVTNVFAISWFGFRGAAVTTVLSEALVLILGMIFVRKTLKFKLDIWNNAKIILSGLIMYGILYPLSDKSILILVPLGGIVYLTCLWLLRGIPAEALEAMRRKK